METPPARSSISDNSKSHSINGISSHPMDLEYILRKTFDEYKKRSNGVAKISSLKCIIEEYGCKVGASEVLTKDAWAKITKLIESEDVGDKELSFEVLKELAIHREGQIESKDIKSGFAHNDVRDDGIPAYRRCPSNLMSYTMRPHESFAPSNSIKLSDKKEDTMIQPPQPPCIQVAPSAERKASHCAIPHLECHQCAVLEALSIVSTTISDHLKELECKGINLISAQIPKRVNTTTLGLPTTLQPAEEGMGHENDGTSCSLELQELRKCVQLLELTNRRIGKTMLLMLQNKEESEKVNKTSPENLNITDLVHSALHKAEANHPIKYNHPNVDVSNEHLEFLTDKISPGLQLFERHDPNLDTNISVIQEITDGCNINLSDEHLFNQGLLEYSTDICSKQSYHKPQRNELEEQDLIDNNRFNSAGIHLLHEKCEIPSVESNKRSYNPLYIILSLVIIFRFAQFFILPPDNHSYKVHYIGLLKPV